MQTKSYVMIWIISYLVKMLITMYYDFFKINEKKTYLYKITTHIHDLSAAFSGLISSTQTTSTWQTYVPFQVHVPYFQLSSLWVSVAVSFAMSHSPCFLFFLWGFLVAAHRQQRHVKIGFCSNWSGRSRKISVDLFCRPTICIAHSPS